MASQTDLLRRALKLIAETPRGCSVPTLLAQGFGAEFVAALLESGVAKTEVDTEVIGGHAHQVRRLWITETGRRLLVGRY
jgi:hypothetical protein